MKYIRNSSVRSIIPAWIMFLCVGFSRSSGVSNEIAPKARSILYSNSGSDNEDNPGILQPISPKASDCFGNFPGTPEWNKCFRKFNSDMINLGAKLQALTKTASNQAEAERAKISNVPPGQYYDSSTTYNSNSMSTSNSFIGGYAIKVVNMQVSTSMANGVIKITLRTGANANDKFNSNIEGNQIKFSAYSRGQNKLAEITVPNSVKMDDVRIDRTVDAIYITGPANTGGNFMWSGSDSSSGSSSSSYSQNYGQQFPMPDFQGGFHNMFQNMFQGFFGPQSAPSRKAAPRNVGSFPFNPVMWFN